MLQVQRQLKSGSVILLRVLRTLNRCIAAVNIFYAKMYPNITIIFPIVLSHTQNTRNATYFFKFTFDNIYILTKKCGVIKPLKQWFLETIA